MDAPSLEGFNERKWCGSFRPSLFSPSTDRISIFLVEEVMSMLLSFPLDPPPSTMDLISDTIYEYSSILDGRRFATEYVIKRKADAANVKANGSKPPGAISAGKSTLADGMCLPHDHLRRLSTSSHITCSLQS